MPHLRFRPLRALSAVIVALSACSPPEDLRQDLSDLGADLHTEAVTATEDLRAQGNEWARQAQIAVFDWAFEEIDRDGSHDLSVDELKAAARQRFEQLAPAGSLQPAALGQGTAWPTDAQGASRWAGNQLLQRASPYTGVPAGQPVRWGDVERGLDQALRQHSHAAPSGMGVREFADLLMPRPGSR